MCFKWYTFSDHSHDAVFHLEELKPDITNSPSSFPKSITNSPKEVKIYLIPLSFIMLQNIALDEDLLQSSIFILFLQSSIPQNGLRYPTLPLSSHLHVNY